MRSTLCVTPLDAHRFTATLAKVRHKMQCHHNHHKYVYVVVVRLRSADSRVRVVRGGRRGLSISNVTPDIPLLGHLPRSGRILLLSEALHALRTLHKIAVRN